MLLRWTFLLANPENNLIGRFETHTIRLIRVYNIISITKILLGYTSNHTFFFGQESNHTFY